MVRQTEKERTQELWARRVLASTVRDVLARRRVNGAAHASARNPSALSGPVASLWFPRRPSVVKGTGAICRQSPEAAVRTGAAEQSP